MTGAWHDPSFTWKDKIFVIALNATLLKSFFQATVTSGIPTGWSLTVEETFYVVSPLFLISIRRNAKYLWLYPIVSLLVGSLLVYACSLVPYYLYGFMKSMNFMLRFTFFGRCAEFMYGAALALYIAKYPPHTLTKSVTTGCSLLGVVACIIILAVIKTHYIPTNAWPTSVFSIPVQNVLLPLFATLLLYGLITETSIIRKFLETDIIVLIGKSSYALYLLHTGPLDDLFTSYISESILLKMVCYLLVSIVLFKTIEEPIRILLRKTTTSIA